MEAWLSPRTLPQAPVVVGTMNFGKRTSEEEARRIVDRSFARGVPVFDTANAYNDGESERILGRALRGRRKEARIAARAGAWVRKGASEGLARGRVRDASDESLQRLGVEQIDLYYLHKPDLKTPIDETVGAMHDLLRAGKIANWGVSNYASWQIVEMEGLCDRAGMARPAVSQVIYNVLVRQLDIEYFPFARKHPIHTTVYNPLAGGLVAGKGLRKQPEPGSRFDKNPMYQERYLSGRFFELVVGAVGIRAALRARSRNRLPQSWLVRRLPARRPREAVRAAAADGARAGALPRPRAGKAPRRGARRAGRLRRRRSRRSRFRE